MVHGPVLRVEPGLETLHLVLVNLIAEVASASSVWDENTIIMFRYFFHSLIMLPVYTEPRKATAQQSDPRFFYFASPVNEIRDT